MTVYKGGIGQTAWILHRVTGVAVLLFLLIHILDTALIMVGPKWYNMLMGIYRHPLFGLMEIGLFAAVLYHSLNGVRILLIDFWPPYTLYHEKIFLGMMALFALIFLPVGFIMLGHTLEAMR
jgi:succinate dehydrogenase / fumarate reductase, cytochrome b subunit